MMIMPSALSDAGRRSRRRRHTASHDMRWLRSVTATLTTSRYFRQYLKRARSVAASLRAADARHADAMRARHTAPEEIRHNAMPRCATLYAECEG